MKRKLYRVPQKIHPHPAAVTRLPTDLSKVRIKPVPLTVKPPPPPALQSKLVRALLIGIEYADYAQQQKMNRLPGCHADVQALKTLLQTQYALTNAQIEILTDEASSHKDQRPTRQNIERAMQRLQQAAATSQDGKILFYYSGHGTQQTDTNQDENDGSDECFVPCDYQEAGIISDDWAASILLAQLPKTVQCVLVVDACNSGTIFDLPWVYNPEKKTWTPNAQTQSTYPAHIMSLSGCRDDQASASALFGLKGWRGALTLTLQQLLQTTPFLNNQGVISKCLESLQTQSFVQKPQLSCSRADLECLTWPFF